MRTLLARRRGGPRSRGQSLVEFALILPIFVLLLLAVFDFGRGIYTYNGLSEAARDIARTTIVNSQQGALGSSPATRRSVDTQKGLVPGLRVVSYECLFYDGTAVPPSEPCHASGYLIKVTVASSYMPTALLGLGGPIELSSSSSLQIP
jgi:TadE-like protein